MYDLQKIERARIVRGLRKQDVARLAGISPSSYTLILQGRLKSPPTVKAVCDALGIAMEDVYRGDQHAA